ncbi:TadE/TadG family type IV pilus assembly protein [Kitasatospora aureofaciens]|uniref:TadE/TadG family type IV pilus assembly protein n=1 Tax=Kitasatospora aureofaciens TaxID=1894 RepID=UPI001C48A12B|nr:TadE/TadG family type IV pilus assembly protein [Kitasatospora aureofaciens]MBV6697904.1 pilus assembly protein [Kitasatospora aureofaciens]
MAVEAAIVAPYVVGLVLIAIAAGRLQTTSGTVEAAARSAARTASLARSFDGMEEPARTTVEQELKQQGVSCQDLNVAVTLGELKLPGGAVATVKVRVVCKVGLGDLLGWLSGVPVTKTLAGEFTSVVDRYRGA